MGWHGVDRIMRTRRFVDERRRERAVSDETGFSLIETMISMGVMAVGLFSLGAAFAIGTVQLREQESRLVAKEKAREAVETVFVARDTRVLDWGSVRNVSHGGIFLDGSRPMKVAGPDGLLNTGDDGAVEQIVLPGPDETVGTSDDEVLSLQLFTRTIAIVDLGPNLRQITVTITYPVGSAVRDYVLTTYIAAYA